MDYQCPKGVARTTIDKAFELLCHSGIITPDEGSDICESLVQEHLEDAITNVWYKELGTHYGGLLESGLKTILSGQYTIGNLIDYIGIDGWGEVSCSSLDKYIGNNISEFLNDLCEYCDTDNDDILGQLLSVLPSSVPLRSLKKYCKEVYDILSIAYSYDKIKPIDRDWETILT